MDTNDIHPITECYKLLRQPKAGKAEAARASSMLNEWEKVTTLAMLADTLEANEWVTPRSGQKASVYYAAKSPRDPQPPYDLRKGDFVSNFNFIQNAKENQQSLERYVEFISGRQGALLDSDTVMRASNNMIEIAPARIVNDIQCAIAKKWGLEPENYRLSNPTDFNLETNFVKLFHHKENARRAEKVVRAISRPKPVATA